MLSTSEPTDPPRHLINQTITLPDKRLLGFAEYGDPSGYPLMFFNGFPSCRYEVWPIHSMLKRKRIRLIAPDRPGFGLSTFQPNRKIIDYASDVENLANHLELDRFAVIGASGGGPYALACAKVIPAERLSAVGLFASAGPLRVEGEGGEELMRDIRPSSKLFAKGVIWVPRFKNWLIKLAIWTVHWALCQQWIIKLLDSRIRESKVKAPMGKGGPEETTEGRPGPGEFLAVFFKETFCQGSEPTLQEAQLFASPWGFESSDISYDKIQLYHGTRDVNAPINQIRYMVERLPHCTLKEYDTDHFGMAGNLDEILDEIITDKVRGLE
jgi:pimeloyl-ACP methyl ester carboxylesterase